MAEKYAVVSCMNASENGETFLLRNIADDTKYILKIRAEKDKYRAEAEMTALSALAENGASVPRVVYFGENNNRVFLLREYIEGDTLEEIFQDKGGLEEEELVKIGMAVCTQLSFLHNLQKPIIHRDIKPQNIILNSIGEIQLIDFDAARCYNEHKERDTHFFGTEQTAAPEQYGFEQTDARTDLYGLGKTLIYLASGSYDPMQIKKLSCSKDFKSVLSGSVSMLKKERPKSAEALYKQLDRCERKRKNRWKRALCSVVAALCSVSLIIWGVFALNEYGKSRTVEFSSPLMEEAVRTALNVDEDTTITYNDLENITELKIIGTAVLDSESSGEYYFMVEDKLDYQSTDEFKKNGGIIDISIISKMTNLRTLYLSNQNISDISPLKNLHLTTLVLSNNYIEDCSCLSEMTTLKALYIGNNRISDLEFLRGNNSLEVLNINMDTVDSFKPLEETAITHLWVLKSKSNDNSFDSINRIETLQYLAIYNFTEEQMHALKDNSYIQGIDLWGEYGADSVSALGRMENLQMLNITSPQFKTLDGIENFPSLRDLIIGSGIRDYSPIAENTNIFSINIRECVEVDYDVILNHPAIRYIYCSQEQADDISRLNTDKYFEIVII